MKKYISLEFDDRGRPVIGDKKNKPTGFVPTTWVLTNDESPIVGKAKVDYARCE